MRRGGELYDAFDEQLCRGETILKCGYEIRGVAFDEIVDRGCGRRLSRSVTMYTGSLGWQRKLGLTRQTSRTR
jgi:hypothetical protein